MKKKVIYLKDIKQRDHAKEIIDQVGDDYQCTISKVTRNLAQNAVMWKMLNEFSMQKMWPVNDENCLLTPEEWKDLLTACYRKESIRIAEGIDGGSVMVGLSTRKFSKFEMSDFLEYINMVAIELGVII